MSSRAHPYRLRILRRLLSKRGSILRTPATWNERIQAVIRQFPIAPVPAPAGETLAYGPGPAPRLRIALFTRWGLGQGGLGRYIRTLRDGLVRRGHYVKVITRPSPRTWKALVVRSRRRCRKRLRPVAGRYARLLAKREAELRAYTRLVRRLNLRSYDVLHAQDLFTANVLIELRPWHRRPVVYTPHGIMSLRKRIRGMRASPAVRFYHRVLDHIAASGADHIIVLSRRVADRLLRMGADQARLTVSPTGIPDPGLPAPAARSGSATRITVTYVGRMRPSKGPQILLRAMARVRRRAPRVRVWLLGKGPSLRALRRLSRRLRLRHVKFWGHQRNIYRFLRRSDILVVPGLDETFPIALIEGLLAGQAVIGSRCGGIPEMIEHGRTGLLFEPGDARDLARQILRLVADRQLRLALATAGQLHARARFTVDRMVREIEVVYAALQSNRREGASA